MKIAFSICLALTLFLLPVCWNVVNAQPGPKPPTNVIFILTDDLGYGDVGAFYQNQRHKENIRSEPSHFTPNLDQLALSGARLTQQYCNAPVCAPSRASLLLGVHQGHANVRDNQFDKALENNYTLGNVLQKAGYSTVSIGKWGLQGEERWGKGTGWTSLPQDRGFNDFFGYIRHVDGHEHYPKEGLYRGAKEVYNDQNEISSVLDKCYTGDLWTAYAKQWILNHSKESEPRKPFFMYLAYDIPHAVLELPTQAYPDGGGLKGGMQWVGVEGRMISTASGEIDSYVHPDYANATYDNDKNPSTPEVSWPDTYKRYATIVRRIDDAVGDIRQLLVDLEMDENTVIVFTSDNGPSLESYLPGSFTRNQPTFFNSFGPFDGIKRDVWEGGVREPTIISWPRSIPANQVIETPSMFSDWMATFCDIAGVAAPARSDGVSLLPSLTGKGSQQSSTVYVEYFNNQTTPGYQEFEEARRGRARNQMQLIRVNDYVGVRYDIKSADDDFEIYDVVHDPKEATNLAKEANMAKLQQEMKDNVLRLRRPDTSAVRPYDDAFIPAAAVTQNKLVAGITWKTFTGDFPWIPQVNTLTPTSGGTAKDFSPSPLKGKSSVLVCEGFIKVSEDGTYTFAIKAEGQALLRIHKAVVIDADYGYDSGTSRMASIKLAAGYHPFTLYYKKNAKGKPGLSVSWAGPGFEMRAVPATALYRD